MNNVLPGSNLVVLKYGNKVIFSQIIATPALKPTVMTVNLPTSPVSSPSTPSSGKITKWQCAKGKTLLKFSGQSPSCPDGYKKLAN
jgi:hypothetical protein